MNVSAKVDYACLAILALAARHETGQPVSLRSLADTHGIPSQFLAQIFQQLKAAGLVRSVRGATGGYFLRRAPDEICLWDVVVAIEAPEVPTSLSTNDPLAGVIRANWQQVAAARREILQRTSFADLVREVSVHSEPMYYI